MRGIRNTQISRANDKQLQKLKLLKPTISTRKLAKARVREEKGSMVTTNGLRLATY